VGLVEDNQHNALVDPSNKTLHRTDDKFCKLAVRADQIVVNLRLNALSVRCNKDIIQ
jgi:hypothetical protein